MNPKLLMFFIIALALSSCATILNYRNTLLAIVTDKPVKIIVDGDSLTPEKSLETFDIFEEKIKSNQLKTYNKHLKKDFNLFRDSIRSGKAFTIMVKRERRPIDLSITDDTILYNYKLKSTIKTKFWVGIFSTPIIPIDLFSIKKYSYKNVYIAFNDSIPETETLTLYARANQQPVLEDSKYFEKYYSKGRFLITIGIPFINTFSTYPDKLSCRKNNAGFWGISIGLDYQYSKHRSISFETNRIIDFILPFPAPVDYYGDWEFSSRINFSLLNNYHLRRFSFGYGINISKNIWKYIYFDYVSRDDKPEPKYPCDRINDINWAIGPIFNTYWKMDIGCRMGIVYRPSIYRLKSNTPWKYEHSLSLDFHFDINTGKKVVHKPHNHYKILRLME